MQLQSISSYALALIELFGWQRCTAGSSQCKEDPVLVGDGEVEEGGEQVWKTQIHATFDFMWCAKYEEFAGLVD